MGKMDGKSGVAGTSFPKRRKGMNPNWLEILGFPISQPLYLRPNKVLERRSISEVGCKKRADGHYFPHTFP